MSASFADVVEPVVQTQNVIANLRAKLANLNQHTADEQRLFRLSFSIMTLETCLEERGLTEIRLSNAPGIQALIGRIENEIETLRDQSIASSPILNGDLPSVIKQEIIGLMTPSIDAGEGSKALPHQVSHLSRQLDDLRETLTQPDTATALQKGFEGLQKSLSADGRRNFASLAALHASIERLSERIERFESRLTRDKEPVSGAATANVTTALAAREKGYIDPRPMLAAARAAAARASMDIEPKILIQPLDTDRAEQPGSGNFPELPSQPQRRKRWGFAFAAA